MIPRKKKRGYPVEENKKEQVNQDIDENMEGSQAQEELQEEAAVELSQVQKLEKQCSDYLDKYQRTLAEFDNFRKRTSKEKAVMMDDGVRNTIEKLLPIIDNLERAVVVQEGKAEEGDAFFKGIQMILTQFQETLAALEVTEIPALGEKFNPALHAAVAHEDSEAHGENEIMLVMLKGYQHKDKVIRHSMVKVAN